MPVIQRLDGTFETVTEAEIATAPQFTDLAAAKADFVDWIDRMVDQVRAQYPKAVRDIWPEEEAMARAYLATPRTATVAEIDTLTQDADAKNRTVQEHCDIIVDKADTFRAIATSARNLLLATEQDLSEVQSADEYADVLVSARALGVALFDFFGIPNIDA